MNGINLSRRRLLGLPHPERHPDESRTAHRAPSTGAQRRMLFRPQDGPPGDVLVCIFLRGGADGLHLVAPYGDSAYYAERPRIAVARPDDRRVPRDRRGVALDGFFALHPALAPLQEAYRAGHLAIVHAVGSPDESRSHFEAMATMERGVGDGSTATAGWLGRHLASAPGAGQTAPARVGSTSSPPSAGTRSARTSSPLRALAIGDTLPQSLEGALGATAVPSLEAFRLALPAGWSDGFRAALAGLYEADHGPAADAGRETLQLLRSLEQMDPARYRPAGGAQYPESDFGRGLRQIAQLIRAELGLEVACLDLGGWDSHIGQETLLEELMRDLAGGLAAFHADLGETGGRRGEQGRRGAEMGRRGGLPLLDRVTVVVMSEFGRRVRENGGLGTDHGRATCFWLLGGGIAGGRVLADWPGLAEERLDGPGDLRVTIDYRDLLAEVVARRLRNPDWARVFPDYTPRFRSLCHERS